MEQSVRATTLYLDQTIGVIGIRVNLSSRNALLVIAALGLTKPHVAFSTLALFIEQGFFAVNVTGIFLFQF